MRAYEKENIDMNRDSFRQEIEEFAPWDWIAGFALAAVLFLIMFGLAESI